MIVLRVIELLHSTSTLLVIFSFVTPSILQRSTMLLDKKLVPRSESRNSGTPNIVQPRSNESVYMLCLLLWNSVDDVPFGKQILYCHLVPVSFVCWREVYYVCSQNLKWCGHRDWMQWRLAHSTIDNSTLRSSCCKLLGVAELPLPPPENCTSVGLRSGLRRSRNGFPSKAVAAAEKTGILSRFTHTKPGPAGGLRGVTTCCIKS